MDIKRIGAKLVNLIKRGATTNVMNDKDQIPVVQVRYLNKTAIIEVLTPYGFDHSPPVGSWATIFNVMAQEENRTAIIHNHPRRFKNLKEGEVSVGNYITKARIYLKANGDIDVTVPGNHNINVTGNQNVNIGGNETVQVDGGLVEYTTGVFRIRGELRVTEDIIWDEDNTAVRLNDFRDIYNRHVHPENDVPNDTDAPIPGDRLPT